MKVSYTWLSKYFDKKLPTPEKLTELFNIHFSEVEGVEKIGDDTVLDVKVLPDRAHYALGHKGVAYETHVITGIPLGKIVSEELVFPTDKKITAPKVEIKSSLCRRYIARKIENIKIGKSPETIARSLETIGQKSINNVVDMMNYVMYDVGQPLHAFDADKVKGTIIVRLAKEGETMVTLDNRDIVLLTSDLVITDDEGVLAIAGVKGGKRAEVNASTKDIIIEAANFDPTTVRRTATRLNLRTDASKRYENEITSELAFAGMENVTKLIADHVKGVKISPTNDVYPYKAQMWSVEITLSEISEMLGAKILEKEVLDILSRVALDVENKKGTITVHVPPERLDLKIKEDVADEVGRLYGYDKIPSALPPKISGNLPIDKTFYHAEKVKNILVGLGFSEVQTYTLAAKGAFAISYPMASDKSALRESLSPRMTEALTRNALNAPILGLKDVKIFEIGKVFPKTGERMSLAIGSTSEKLVKEALVALNIPNAKIVNKISEIDFDEIVSKLPSAENISDLNFISLSKDKKYKPFSAYPFIVRDIAFFVPENTKEEEVLSTLSAVTKSGAEYNGEYLVVKGPDCFDRFSKDGKTSFAFRMIFQSRVRTLSDEEVNGYMAIIQGLIASKDWEVR